MSVKNPVPRRHPSFTMEELKLLRWALVHVSAANPIDEARCKLPLTKIANSIAYREDQNQRRAKRRA
jgi:hypothetical protein